MDYENRLRNTERAILAIGDVLSQANLFANNEEGRKVIATFTESLASITSALGDPPLTAWQQDCPDADPDAPPINEVEYFALLDQIKLLKIDLDYAKVSLVRIAIAARDFTSRIGHLDIPPSAMQSMINLSQYSETILNKK